MSMRGFVSTILEVLVHRSGPGLRWLALLWIPVGFLSAQGQVINVPEVEKSEDCPGFAEISRPPAIERLEEKFRSQDYTAAVEDARALFPGLPGDSPDLDTLLFIEGVSLYYSGRHEEAQLSLDRHRADFPMSSHAQRIHYYSGSNLLKRSCWRVAGNVLDNFINDFPKSSLMDYALYDRATVHLALEENQACFLLAERLEERFVDSDLIDRAAFLKGEVLRRTGDMARSESAFIIAKNIARRKGHAKVAAHALCRLIEVSFQQGRYVDSADYYDTFFLTYPMSARALEAVAAGLPALSELGRIMSGLNRMEDLIITMTMGMPAKRLHVALKLYAKYFSEGHSPGELLKRYRDLSSAARGNEQLRQALIMARLEVMETYFTDRDAEVEVFYDEVRSRISRDNLSAYMVMKIARHVSRYDRDEAVLWLSELLERPAVQCRDEVIVSMAVLHSASGDTAHKNLARGGFEVFLSDYGSPELMERAVLGLARVSEQLKDWPRARQCWMEYLSRPDWKSAQEEALQGIDRVQALSNEQDVRPVVNRFAVSPNRMVARERVENPVMGIGGKLASRIERAEKLMRSGFSEKALEILGKVVMDGGRIRKPDADVTALIHRAGILRENLQFALQEY